MAKLKQAKILIVFASLLIIISSASYEVYGSKRRARAAQYDDIEPSYKKRKIPPSYQYDPSNSNSNSNSGGPGNANSVNPLMSNSYQSVPPQNQFPSANAISNPSNHPYMSVFDQSRLNQKVQEFKDLVKAAHQPVKNQSRPISQNGQPQGNIYQQPQNNVSRKHEDNIMSQQYNSKVSLQHMTNVGQQQA
eukprot:578022_1